MTGAPDERGARFGRAAVEAHPDAELPPALANPLQRRLLPWIPAAIGGGIFLVLWLIDSPYRYAYQATDNDVTALADGLLLVPGSRWQDWFVQGHSHFFDAYPEWPLGLTAFARPAFQCLIYLAHFVFGRDWPSYLAINYLGIAGIAAVAYAIARSALRLGVAASLLAAALVLCSPAVLEFSIWQLGFASESLACVLIGAAFLASLARRDGLCIAILVVALFTKETAIWAPVAAAATALLRPAPSDTGPRRARAAAAMLLPLAIWFGFRFTVYGGIGGTYATAEYSPLGEFLGLTGQKIAHLHHLFIQQIPFVEAGRWATADQAVRVATALMLLALLALWARAALRFAWAMAAPALRQRRWPVADPALLTTIWFAMGLAFYLALAVPSTRYAAAAVMFAWPVIVAAVIRHRQAAWRFAVLACLVLSAARTAYFLAEMNAPLESEIGPFLRSAAKTNAALRQIPPGIHEVYVLLASGLVTANPEYLRAFLGIDAKIVRIIDLSWYCGDRPEAVTLSHDARDGEVIIRASLPDCARFEFLSSTVNGTALHDGQLHRSASVDYELPEAHPIYHTGPLRPTVEPGRQMIVHIRPRGPARFIIDDPSPARGLVSFDTP
jgi:hypothetical protein